MPVEIKIFKNFKTLLLKLFVASVKRDHVLLVANDYRHTIHGLDPTSDMTSFYSYKVPSTDRPICVTYDPARSYLYWSEFNQGIIKRMLYDGSQTRVLRVGASGNSMCNVLRGNTITITHP